MPFSVWILLAIVVVVLAVGLARKRALRGADFTDMTITPELAERVRGTAVGGQKVLAVKILRDETGMALVAAKLVVDRMVARHQRGSAGPGRSLGPEQLG